MVNPKLYASSDNLQTRNVELVIEEFADDLMKMSGKCMDIGCGPGNSTKDLLLPALHSNAAVIGTDISESMIKYANRNYNDKRRLKFEVLDIQTKHLPKKYVSEFDHIFSFHALHWCTDIEQAFKNIYRMLRPGGSMLTLIIASHDVADTFKTLAEDVRFAPYLKNLKRTYPFNNVPHSQKMVKILLKNIGFNIRHCSLREGSSINQDKFINSMISMCSSIDEMTADQKEQFKSSFKREYLSRKIVYTSRNNDEEQTYILDIYSMLIIYAVKGKTKHNR